jgi:hypothetical protein
LARPLWLLARAKFLLLEPRQLLGPHLKRKITSSVSSILPLTADNWAPVYDGGRSISAHHRFEFNSMHSIAAAGIFLLTRYDRPENDYLSVSLDTPSARLIPSWPSTDSGCKEIV